MTAGRQPRALRGFTLLELLVVLAIAGLLIAAVPPLISAVIPGAELKGAVRELAVSLKRARFDAVSRGVPVDVTFSRDAARYAIGDEPPQALPRNAELHVGPLPTSGDHARHFRATMADDYRLRFFPDGSSSGASIVFRRDAHRYAVTVGWLMGRVTIDQDDASVF